MGDQRAALWAQEFSEGLHFRPTSYAFGFCDVCLMALQNNYFMDFCNENRKLSVGQQSEDKHRE